ncbi:hypothetical protein NDR87_18910 [Nocardia sp. CDC159]|uniref:Uncharacterized protein n=1 Tax=Nocardia pulmonis TaxID=2951408 RepID=A0A9X2EBQ2_9NOCA|nr:MULTISPECIES: hypothetical protein [Nocardia]MCM6776238.1 hypothetical protein [Nocardia pulmonis]MCM6788436.1 hypothetical protein [Nocardia sp. CDC159]
MNRLHLPHPHIADRFVHALSEGVWAGLLHREHWREPPTRTAPPADDWPEWHWADR